MDEQMKDLTTVIYDQLTFIYIYILTIFHWILPYL